MIGSQEGKEGEDTNGMFERQEGKGSEHNERECEARKGRRMDGQEKISIPPCLNVQKNSKIPQIEGTQIVGSGGF